MKIHSYLLALFTYEMVTLFLEQLKLRPTTVKRIKCSRLISSLLGLQGQKNFADAIIKILIPTKSIIEKNCYDQLFIT